MNTNNKEQEIDLVQLFLYIWDHIGMVILVGIIMAALMGGFKAVNKNTPLDKKQVYEDVITKNKEAANPPAGQYNYYSDRDIVEGSCVIKGQIFVDFNFPNIENTENLEYNNIVMRYQNDAINRFKSTDSLLAVVSDVNESEYGDIDPLTVHNLNYMVSCNYAGTNVFNYSITDIDKERALAIANKISRVFVDNSTNIDIIKEVSIIETPAVYYDGTNKVEETTIFDIIKFAIIGGFVGIISMIAVYLLLFLFKNAVRTSEDIGFIGLYTFSRIPIKEVYRKAEYKRLAYNISILDNTNKILIAPVDPKTDIGELFEKVTEELKNLKKDVKLVKVDNIIESPDVTLEAKASDAVILVTTFGETKIKDLEYAKGEVDKTHVKLLGAVIDKCKH